ncbi:hypothetical protein LLEC1_02584 [Akanthomyces lecanii]|uniref:Zn(2)-C6 fungal-type domain-containing protein n=1 Tax=Cordyceps confragosa TaxID=2714763 RepID=A0A179I9Z1_CORDF|nr:hypothetical protein LLEC1_02584 [Akanthomyces lecanii]
MGSESQKWLPDVQVCRRPNLSGIWFALQASILRLTEKQRKRRVKCDETKSARRKCISAQKQCLYPRPPPPASVIQRSLYPAPVIGTPQELSLSKHFLGNVIKFLSDDFNGEFWRDSLPQVMHNVEAIRHGSNAIASLSMSHRVADDGLAKESTRQYSMSMKHVLQIAQTPSITPKSKAIVMLANVLYGIYALFSGDTVANMVLHEKTRRLIRHWEFWECTECASVSDLSMQLLHHFLKSRTLRQGALFIYSEPPSQTWLEAIIWFQERPMWSILQAYVEFEMIWISLRATLDNLPFRPTKKDIVVAAAGRTVLRRHFEKWERRYRALRHTNPPLSLHVYIFRARSILARILFKLDLDEAEHLWDETCYDACDAEFIDAFLVLEQALEQENKETRRAEFDTQFTPSLCKALTFVAKACRRPVLRRDAIALLRHSLTVATGRLSNISGNSVMEFVADQIIDLEEIAWRDAAARDDCAEGSTCARDDPCRALRYSECQILLVELVGLRNPLLLVCARNDVSY